MMPAMERLALEDLREPGATLGAGVSAGFLAGVLIGGVGGRLAMLALRLTSDPSLHGVSTDDGFTIGRLSLQTLFLLGLPPGWAWRAVFSIWWFAGGSRRRGASHS
jgi:hypothetical protein